MTLSFRNMNLRVAFLSEGDTLLVWLYSFWRWKVDQFNTIIGALILWNLFIFTLYGIDKRKAVHGQRRISEKTMLLCAFLMGGIGALCGMKFFKHKTKHLKFKICLPLAAVLNIAVVWFRIL